MKCNHTSSRTKYDCFRGQSERLPLQTVTQTHGFAVAAPVVVRQFGNSTGQRADPSVGTIMPGSGGETQLANAVLVGAGGLTYSGKPRSIAAPMATIPTESHAALAAMHLIRFRQGSKGQGVLRPFNTLTASGNHIGHVTAYLQKYYGNEKDGIYVDAPMHTVPTHDRFGLTEVKCEPTLLTDTNVIKPGAACV